MKYGLWIEDRGWYTGWIGFTAEDVLVPWAFSTLDDAEKGMEGVVAYLRDRPCATVEVKANPPEELPWNEVEWRKSKQ